MTQRYKPWRYKPSRQAARKQTPHHVVGGSEAYLAGDEETLGGTKEKTEVGLVRDAAGATAVSDLVEIARDLAANGIVGRVLQMKPT